MSSSSVGVRKNSSLSRGIKIRGVAFSRCRISTYNSRGRDTGLVVVGVGHRKECEFRERSGWQKGEDSCCTRRAFMFGPVCHKTVHVGYAHVMVFCGVLGYSSSIRFTWCCLPLSGLRYSIVKLLVLGSKERTLILMVGLCFFEEGDLLCFHG